MYYSRLYVFGGGISLTREAHDYNNEIDLWTPFADNNCLQREETRAKHMFPRGELTTHPKLFSSLRAPSNAISFQSPPN